MEAGLDKLPWVNDEVGVCMKEGGVVWVPHKKRMKCEFWEYDLS